MTHRNLAENWIFKRLVKNAHPEEGVPKQYVAVTTDKDNATDNCFATAS